MVMLKNIENNLKKKHAHGGSGKFGYICRQVRCCHRNALFQCNTNMTLSFISSQFQQTNNLVKFNLLKATDAELKWISAWTTNSSRTTASSTIPRRPKERNRPRKSRWKIFSGFRTTSGLRTKPGRVLWKMLRNPR